jgi:hypothetical protein
MTNLPLARSEVAPGRASGAWVPEKCTYRLAVRLLDVEHLDDLVCRDVGYRLAGGRSGSEIEDRHAIHPRPFGRFAVDRANVRYGDKAPKNAFGF